MDHTPFSHPLKDLSPQDISSLLTDGIPEGYRVEYKLAIPSREKVANSFASFANSSGGWYLVGIKADKQTNVPIEIPGISLTDHPDPISTLRDTVKSMISPIPPFEIRLVQMQPDRYVLVAYIPEGDDTPYYTRDGRIYRRVADSSDPISENDRHAIDRLIDRGRATDRGFEAFCNDPRVLASSGGAWLSVFLRPSLPSPLVRPNDWISAQLLSSTRSHFSTQTHVDLGDGNAYFDSQLRFDTALLGFDALILRHQPTNDLVTPSLEIELFFDGRCRLFIPIVPREAWTPANIGSITSLKARNVVARIHTTPSFPRLSFFEIRDIWFALALVATTYERHLRASAALSTTEPVSFRWRLQFRGIANHVAFVDHDSWADFVSLSNLPVVQHDVIAIPELHARQNTLIATADTPLWAHLASRSCICLGLPEEVLGSFLRGDNPRDA